MMAFACHPIYYSKILRIRSIETNYINSETHIHQHQATLKRLVYVYVCVPICLRRSKETSVIWAVNTELDSLQITKTKALIALMFWMNGFEFLLFYSFKSASIAWRRGSAQSRAFAHFHPLYVSKNMYLSTYIQRRKTLDIAKQHSWNVKSVNSLIRSSDQINKFRLGDEYLPSLETLPFHL